MVGPETQGDPTVLKHHAASLFNSAWGDQAFRHRFGKVQTQPPCFCHTACMRFGCQQNPLPFRSSTEAAVAIAIPGIRCSSCSAPEGVQTRLTRVSLTSWQRADGVIWGFWLPGRMCIQTTANRCWTGSAETLSSTKCGAWLHLLAQDTGAAPCHPCDFPSFMHHTDCGMLRIPSTPSFA